MPSADGRQSDQPDDREQRDEEFRELIGRVRARDPAAEKRLYENFESPVRRIVRRHLRQPLRTRYDSDDFSQDVWKIAFARIQDGQDFAAPGQFIAFLARTTINTTLKRVRSDLKTQKRSALLEEPIGRHAGELLAHSVLDGDPAKQAAAKEEDASVLAAMSDQDRSIVGGLQNGERMEELAGRLGISSKNLRRILKRRQRIADEACRRSGIPA